MENNTLKNQAYYEIKTRILSCTFPPGTLLNESMLCELLSFSRTPVRDALSRLENENLVRITPPKGVVVTDITINDVSSFLEALLHFDPYLIRTCPSVFAEENCSQLLSSGINSKNSTNDQIVRTFLMTFHKILASATDNLYMIELYDHLANLEQRLLHLINIPQANYSPLLERIQTFYPEFQKKNPEQTAMLITDILKLYQDIIIAAFLNYAKTLPPQEASITE